MNRLSGWIVALSALAIAVLLSVLVYRDTHRPGAAELTSTYHAVLLTNGQAFYGRLENLQSEQPVLRDVFYVQSRINPETKQPHNVLVKRGGEWHSPDRMILNKRHVLLVEPVKEDSQVAKFIAEQNRR